MNTPGYESLALVLRMAYAQAAEGKGKERHAGDRPFTEQPMQSISDLVGSNDGLLYQAMKKIQESKRLDRDAAIRELLGAINYLAGAIIWWEKQDAEPAQQSADPAKKPGMTLADAVRDWSPRSWICKHTGTVYEREVKATTVRMGTPRCQVCGLTLAEANQK